MTIQNLTFFHFLSWMNDYTKSSSFVDDIALKSVDVEILILHIVEFNVIGNTTERQCSALD